MAGRDVCRAASSSRSSRSRCCSSRPPVHCCLLPGATAGFDLATAAVLVGLYAVLAGVEFPVGAGNVLPTQLVLIPMLVLAPAGTVPFLVAAGLLLARLSDWIRRRGSFERLLFSIPDAWHAVGPAAGPPVRRLPAARPERASSAVGAFVSCCVFDAGCAMLREWASRGVAPTLQLPVFGLVWAVDACLAPIGFLAAVVAQRNIFAILFVVPLAGLLLLMASDRRKRIEQAQHRLEVAIRERGRLQAAVRRMGDAFAAKLDIDALLNIMLRGSIEALAADAGALQFKDREPRLVPENSTTGLRRRPPRRRRRRRRHQPSPADRTCRGLGTGAAVRGRGRRRCQCRHLPRPPRAPFPARRIELLSESSPRRRRRRPTSSATTRCATRRSATP